LLLRLPVPPQRRSTCSRVDFERARAAHRKLLRGKPAHPGRLALEQGRTLAVGATWYWIYKDLNATDWDLEPTAKNFGRRFYDPSLFRFDTNRFFVNQEQLPCWISACVLHVFGERVRSTRPAPWSG
jgi:hypothetical protein